MKKKSKKKEMKTKSKNWLVILIAVVMLSCVFEGVDLSFPHKVPSEGVIVDMKFVQGKQSGEWLAMVRMSDAEVVKVKCKAEHFYDHRLGDTLQFTKHYGRLTGWMRNAISIK